MTKTALLIRHLIRDLGWLSTRQAFGRDRDAAYSGFPQRGAIFSTPCFSNDRHISTNVPYTLGADGLTLSLIEANNLNTYPMIFSWKHEGQQLNAYGRYVSV